MTREQFTPTFLVLARAYLKDETVIKNRIETYFTALRDCNINGFMEVVNKEVKYDISTSEYKHLQHPSYYRTECHKLESAKRVHSEDSWFDRVRKDPMYGKRPADIKGMIEFYEILAKHCNTNAKSELAQKANKISGRAGCFETVGQCIGGWAKEETRRMGFK